MKSSTPLPDQMIAQDRRQRLQRLKDKGIVKHYTITIRNDARGKWAFSYHGHLTWFQGFLISLAGWTIEEVE